jgi:hypothetical protein
MVPRNFAQIYLCITVSYACEFGILCAAQWWKKHGGSIVGRGLKVKSKVEKQIGRDACNRQQQNIILNIILNFEFS